MPELLQKSIGLDKSGKKFTCPQCGQRRFVRMFDFETKEYLPEHVGRCDRENACWYHFTSKQFFENRGIQFKSLVKQVEATPEIIEYMPMDYIKSSMIESENTNFSQWLASLFGKAIAENAINQYLVGRSKADNGKACIFWRVGKEVNVRTGKIMCYDPITGKRNKDVPPSWVHSRLKNFSYHLCFFGEHLLTEYPDKIVGVVESEKTAIIASIYMPNMVWLATGGNSGCKWREWCVFNVLQNREVTFCPDFGYFNKKTQKTCYQEWYERVKAISEIMECKTKVSRTLEDSISADQRQNDYDLADMLIIRNEGQEWALNEVGGYPVMWDL